MTSEDFTDVTLVTDDKKTIKAHRNILSACSPVFKNILQMDTTSSHPIIYLRGIQYSEIESILQFIYLGEAKLHEERMNEFLSVSKNLEIQELSKDVPQIDQSDQNQVIFTEDENSLHDDNITEVEQESTIESNEEVIINREITKLGSKFQCPQCDKVFSHNRGVHAHIRSAHEGVTYACNQCDYEGAQQGNLKTHIQTKHESVKYACNQCDYQATIPFNLKNHIKSKHEGVRYACNQCDYQATQKCRLTYHIRCKH